VTAIQDEAVWVETIQQSACQSCSAQKGCGQRLIAKVTGKTASIRVLPGECDLKTLSVNEQVVIGIPESVVVNGTLLTYILPLLTMVTGVILAASFSTSDSVTALGALFGLVFGGGLVRLYSHLNRDNRAVQPILLGPHGYIPLQSQV
jgi:sigma-E factor negative regulatory protein RseC